MVHILVVILIATHVHVCIGDPSQGPNQGMWESTCGSGTELGEVIGVMDSKTTPSWPTSGFCKIQSKESVSTKAYQVQVDFKGIYANHGPHSGIFYNAQNNNTYEFMYVRLHYNWNQQGCIQTGYVQDGRVVTQLQSACPGEAKGNKEWFEIKVFQDGHRAIIYINGLTALTISNHLPAKGVAGVLQANGYISVAVFKNFQITASPAPTTVPPSTTPAPPQPPTCASNEVCSSKYDMWLDERALAICVAHNVPQSGQVFAVRRLCKSGSPSCNAVCSAPSFMARVPKWRDGQTSTCTTAFHLYTHEARLESLTGSHLASWADTGRPGPSAYVYSGTGCCGCSGCGPNFCCCLLR